ncbi:protein VTE6, chloroplastic-like [Quillaja saponaria]|uniref:Protein VTE6, chloroplastic-like n=1 Tax=Quillaja saponaria TaxID=32244 RepID=A0AAD7QIB9_QUISA|nr:protein VTE6, chloroplastic-like [Quillaja saponaria]
MPFSTLLCIKSPPIFPLQSQHSQLSTLSRLSSKPKPKFLDHSLYPNLPRSPKMVVHVSNIQSAVSEAMSLIQSSPPTWESSILNNVLIFLLGSPILVTGLSLSGICAAFLLGTLTWRAFGPSGFLLVATYFIIGTAATKVKMAQKEAQGVAEKRKGRRGPGSVIGSSAAGCVCAFLSIFGAGGAAYNRLWQLGFVASFCTKLSDTVSSEIGKAYGKTTYLVTTFKVVPRGTEGAVSVEGTLAGLLASIILALVGCFMGQIDTSEAVICVLASQIANLGESIIGAELQDKEGFRWLNNDAVNIINISIGSIIAVFLQQALRTCNVIAVLMQQLVVQHQRTQIFCQFRELKFSKMMAICANMLDMCKC